MKPTPLPRRLVPAAPAETRRGGWARGLLWLALLAACALQAFEIRRRGIDPDEFEHLHAAYMVWRGDVPYRDFFEHHGPLLYYAAQPLFWIFGPELAVLWAGRLAMWVCSLGTLAAAAAIARRLAGPTAGLAAAALLSWTTIFHSKGIELRPDVPATLLVTLAFLMSLEGASDRDRRRRSLLIGLLCGAATLLTQKCIVPAAGLALAAAVREAARGQARQGAQLILWMTAGGAAAWGVAAILFASAGAADDFVRSTIVRLHSWPLRSQRWEHLRPTLVADLTVWCAALAEIVRGLWSGRQRAIWATPRGQTVIAAAMSLGALAWVKATYPQFYLLWFPLLAALAAARLADWCAAVPSPAWRRWLTAGGLALIGAQELLWLRAMQLQSAGPLPRLWEATQADASDSAGAVLIAVVAGTAWVALTLVSRNWTASVATLAAAGMFHAALRNVDAALWSNREQTQIVHDLHWRVGPDRRVLDGFTGYGALRPHASYYWWINEYSVALMTEEERGTGLLARLQGAPPTAVLVDRHLGLLSPEVTQWIREHYAPTASHPVLWLPRERTVPRSLPSAREAPEGQP